MLFQTRILCVMRVNRPRSFLTFRRWMSNSLKGRELESRRPAVLALAHFDEFYGSVFQENWPSIRIGLLSQKKDGVIVNNFSDKERIIENLRGLGAYSVREAFQNQQKKLKKEPLIDPNRNPADIYQIDGRIEEVLVKQQRADLDEIYPHPLDMEAARKIAINLANQQSKIELEGEGVETSVSPVDPTKDQPLAESLKAADYDITRLITPGASGATVSASLYDFVPATKLKGMDDYIPESSHYSYYRDGLDIPIEFELEEDIEFPEMLDVYAFERGNCDTFEYSQKGTTNVLDYHIFPLGFLAPVLAFGIRRGDSILDLISSSGDVPLLISQTLIPDLFVVNCESLNEAQYLYRTLSSYIFDVNGEESNIMVTNTHPFGIEDKNKFDKVFVVAPSTDDRRAVTFDSKENLFRPSNIKERLKLPEVQASYLKSALETVKEGGSVMYCTESLSPIQNDGVVQNALEMLWTSSGSKFVVKDLSRALEPLQPIMKITKSGKFGHLVLPFLPNNCGPLYFCKLVKIKSDKE